MKRLRDLYQDEKGLSAALIAVMMLVLIAFAGLILDGGILIAKRLELSAATDAAASSLAKAYDQPLWENEGIAVFDPILAEEYVIRLLNKNMPSAKLVEIVIDPVQQNKAVLKTKAEVETVFLKAFGINKRTTYISVTCTLG